MVNEWNVYTINVAQNLWYNEEPVDIERSCDSPQFEMVRMDVHQRNCRSIGRDAWAQTSEWQFDMHSVELDYGNTVVSSIQLHCLLYLVPLRGFLHHGPWSCPKVL